MSTILPGVIASYFNTLLLIDNVQLSEIDVLFNGDLIISSSGLPCWAGGPAPEGQSDRGGQVHDYGNVTYLDGLGIGGSKAVKYLRGFSNFASGNNKYNLQNDPFTLEISVWLGDWHDYPQDILTTNAVSRNGWVLRRSGINTLEFNWSITGSDNYSIVLTTTLPLNTRADICIERTSDSRIVGKIDGKVVATATEHTTDWYGGSGGFIVLGMNPTAAGMTYGFTPSWSHWAFDGMIDDYRLCTTKSLYDGKETVAKTTPFKTIGLTDGSGGTF